MLPDLAFPCVYRQNNFRRLRLLPPAIPIALPIWASHYHVNNGDQDGVLFCTSDAPLYQSPGYYREEDIEA